MTTAPPATAPRLPERYLYPRLDANGKHVFTPELTHASRTDPVGLICSTVRSLPIVFVPGTMGSNLKVKGTEEQAWRYDSHIQIGFQQSKRDAAMRQKLLHPDRTEVDPNGNVPKKVGILTKDAHFRQRGWGEIAAASYQGILIWLEETFHGQRGFGVGDSPHRRLNAELRGIASNQDLKILKAFEPLTEAECEKAEEWVYPVYAFGYNWLQTNELSANALAERIRQIIAANNGEHGCCKQVIVVTHSMGGLVARRCAQLPGMLASIAGVVHGVMPAIGAAIAYRRCKAGMWDENAMVSMVIGRTGREITAVFAQAPGSLELLPFEEYRTDWLQFKFGDLPPQTNTLVSGNYHEVIYKTRTKWWGLIKEEWLKPDESAPVRWETYCKALGKALSFQQSIKASYHEKSWAFYGVGMPTCEIVTWQREEGTASKFGIPRPSNQQILEASGADPTHDERGRDHFKDMQVDQSGSSLLTMHGPEVSRHLHSSPQVQVMPTIHYFLRAMRAADDGDGTVPATSGHAPFNYVQQIFSIRGLSHEPAYNSPDARKVVAYAIARAAANASRSFDTPLKQAQK